LHGSGTSSLSTTNLQHSNILFSASWGTGVFGGTSCAAECDSEADLAIGSLIVKTPNGCPLNTPVNCAGGLLYERHFLLLAGFGVSLCVMARLHVSANLAVSFAMYGALHAAALILSLRTRQRSWRMFLFIALSAALSAGIVRIGMAGMRASGALPAYLTPYLVLGSSAMTGAVGYAMLVHLFKVHALGPWEIMAISIACLGATDIAIFTSKHSQFFGPWWLAVLWWQAFSACLWYFDRAQGSKGERTCSGRTPRPRI
jgi:hypothetical protein